MKKAHIDNNNQLLGWYDTDMHSIIPEPNINVSNEQWQIAINNNHNKVNNDGSTEIFDFRSVVERFNQSMDNLRSQRNLLLAETDYLALSDNTLSDDMKTYRQNLRDLPAGKDTVEKCENATWPTKP